jgi:hypothetical protein
VVDLWREKIASFDVLWSRARLFRGRPFPEGWARVVNGVGLASITMRAEENLDALFLLRQYKSSHDRHVHSAKAWLRVKGDMRALLLALDRSTPELPPEPRAYFEDLRALVADTIAFADKWWFRSE